MIGAAGIVWLASTGYQQPLFAVINYNDLLAFLIQYDHPHKDEL